MHVDELPIDGISRTDGSRTDGTITIGTTVHNTTTGGKRITDTGATKADGTTL
jgi:hypothetical protein